MILEIFTQMNTMISIGLNPLKSYIGLYEGIHPMINTLRMNKGRVTIPKEIRIELGLNEDDLVELEIRKPEKQKVVS